MNPTSCIDNKIWFWKIIIPKTIILQPPYQGLNPVRQFIGRIFFVVTVDINDDSVECKQSIR